MWNPGQEQDIKQKKKWQMLQREKTHWNINPKSKAPPLQTTHPHRHVEENEARRRHEGRGNQCYGPDEALSDEQKLHCSSRLQSSSRPTASATCRWWWSGSDGGPDEAQSKFDEHNLPCRPGAYSSKDSIGTRFWEPATETGGLFTTSVPSSMDGVRKRDKFV